MKILIVRFSSIGDIVLTTPIIRALKKQIAGAEIHYLTKKNFLPLLEANPHLSRVYAIEKNINEVLTELKNEQYDYLIDLHHNLRTLQLKFKLSVKCFSFPKLNFKKWILVNLKINKLPKKHIVDRYFETVKALGVKNDNLPSELFYKQEDEINLKAIFGIEKNKFIAVALGAQFQTKQIPTVTLSKILAKIDVPIVLLGGKEDLVKGKELITLLPEKNIHLTCGEYTLMQSACIVSKAKVLLTGDTGMMHIAACFNRQIVSVWGNTIPDLGMYPYLPESSEKLSIHEVNNLSCRPCSKIGYQNCPKGHFNCMNLQDTKAIYQDLIDRINL